MTSSSLANFLSHGSLCRHNFPHCTFCSRFWKSQLPFLPWAVRPLAEACISAQPHHCPSAAALLECDFFTLPVRTAAYFLAGLHPVKTPVHLKWPKQTPIVSENSPNALLEAAPWLIGKHSAFSLTGRFILLHSTVV